MEQPRRSLTHSTQTSNLADILERVLDKGIVIAGDIKVKLVDIELLTIQIRLMIASVDKAKEMGMDWWIRNPDFSSQAMADQTKEIRELRDRIAQLEHAPVPAASGSAFLAVPAARREP
ncbi:MAG: gas vesicle protein [Deltaproteobacteria bacterium]